MAGNTIAGAVHEDTRIVMTMTDGTEYFFYGFLGSDQHEH